MFYMKKILSVLFCLLLVVASLSANTSTNKISIDSDQLLVQPVIINANSKTDKIVVDNPFAGAWSFYLNVIIVFGGALMLLRLATELVGAVIFEGEDSMTNVRKVFIRFATHIGVILLSFGLIALIF